METVKLRSYSGVAKLTGVALCIAGTFYTGPSLSPLLSRHLPFTSPHSSASAQNQGETWIVGTFFHVASVVAWSLWIVLQTALLKEYPNKMLVTATQCVFSAVQAFFAAVVAERDFSMWKLQPDVTLLSVLYSVISCCKKITVNTVAAAEEITANTVAAAAVCCKTFKRTG
ncbi:hypothetical protein EJB05_37328, partial [Eragrostis curvula]